jgi:transcriptional regulator with XRE-family HTH domain
MVCASLGFDQKLPDTLAAVMHQQSHFGDPSLRSAVRGKAGGSAVGTGTLIARRRRELGMSQTDLADDLNRAAGQATLTRHEISRWERGQVSPGRHWLPHLAEVLEIPLRQLRMAARRGDSAADAQPGPDLTDSPWSGDTVAGVIHLGRRDVERREFLASGAFAALTALAIPDVEQLTRPTRLARSFGGVRVGAGEVAAIRQMTRFLGDAASELGGGHARHLAVRYLTHEAAGWLDGTYSERTGRELHVAASQLVHLAGWMAADEGALHGLAQRYYIYSYRLAAEAGDPEVSATALRGLAVEALQAGNAADAVRLADAAAQWIRRLHDYRAVSYFHGTVAEAASLAGDRPTALRHLAESERAMDRAPKTNGESWAAHYTIAPWAQESAITLRQLGDLAGAEEHLGIALHVPGLRQRSRAINLALLSDIHLQRGDLSGALDSWDQFEAAAEAVHSVRLEEAVRDLHRSLQHYRQEPAARELAERMRVYAAAG